MNFFFKNPAFRYFVLFSAGILAQDYLRLESKIILCSVLFLLILLISFHLMRIPEFLTNLSLAMIIFATGSLKAGMDLERNEVNSVKYISDTRKNSFAVLTGIITEIPETDEKGIKLIIECRNFITPTDTLRISGRVIASVKKDIYSKKSGQLPEILPGDEVSLKGKLSSPPGRRNPGEFDYREYLALKDIYKLFFTYGYRNLKVLSHGNLDFIYQRIIFPSKLFALRNIDTLLYGDNASYLKGLVTGERSDISPETKEAFINAGVMHLIAVSGLNVAYVILSVTIVLSLLRIPFKFRIIITCFFLIFYCMFTGSPASILRASYMGILILFSFIIERKIFFYNIISVSALLILLYDTRLLFDTGFILSYSATISMVIIYKRFEESFLRSVETRHSGFSKAFRWILVLFFTSLAAQIGTLPLTSLYFGKISLISLIVNVAAVPLANISLAIGFLQITAAVISFQLSSAVAEANSILLGFQLGFIKFFGGLDYSFIYIKNFNPVFIFLYYLMFGLILFSRSIHVFFRNVLISVLACCIIYIFSKGENSDLKVTFLDVGQGDCALIETADGRNILVDCGNFSKNFDSGEKTIAPFLRRKGIRELDMIILTHLHMDHIGGLNYLLRNFSVGRIIESGQKHRTEYTIETDSLIRSKNIERVIVKSGDMIDRLRDLRIYFLFPTKEITDKSDDPKYGNLNNGSVVFLLKYKETEILFTGDIESSDEKFLTDKYSGFLKADILKTAHHGSITSSTVPFIIKNSPSAAVISCGLYNKFNHPSDIVLNRLQSSGAEIFRTDKEGAVILETDGTVINISNIK
ncbi:MAG: DNA internalization-related competence protein ComEC/Rec2 [Bacteroidetes bacterium]|nr:DNA internalization-related competence protein ComEC/Rec2 [Bacteroidota bacterium]